MIKKKTILLICITFFTVLEAHKIPGIELELKKLENDKIHVSAFFKRSKRPLVGNEVRLVSMFDNRILTTTKTTIKGAILDIPKESYWVYLLVRDNDLVKDGIPPEKGFVKIAKKEKVAFLYTTLSVIGFFIISIFIGYRKSLRFKENLS
ncbi:hypothetical protein [Arcobacter sp. LA11]|uniref:hypothetical protein n=1 Tax=Arcobacter sp. LA11 TaxID=1898176 RepID=UPI0009351D44|nr:hypothetical protein [Arcobacter sp. LA11]